MTEELKQAAQQALEVLKSATSFMSKKARDQHPKTVARLERALTAAQPARDEEQKLAKYLTDLADRLDSITEMPTDMLEAKRYLNEFAQVLKFSASMPTQPAAQAEAHPLASRCYTMSESHLSGHRLILGFETMEAAQAAHAWVANLGKPAAQATPEPVPSYAVKAHAQIEHLLNDLTVEEVHGGLTFYIVKRDLRTSNLIGALRRLHAEHPTATPEPVGEQAAVARDAYDALESERDYWRARARAMIDHADGTCWYWVGDGEDHLDSLVNSLPVVIRADQLRDLLAHPAPGVPEVDYQALIHAAWGKHKYAQGTGGCIAFKRGAEWFRDIALAAAPAKGATHG